MTSRSSLVGSVIVVVVGTSVVAFTAPESEAPPQAEADKSRQTETANFLMSPFWHTCVGVVPVGYCSLGQRDFTHSTASGVDDVYHRSGFFAAEHDEAQPAQG